AVDLDEALRARAAYRDRGSRLAESLG
ncbi:MAG: hypothetical protein QOD96_3235, partial [Pseudonocardiales bacterium]|nr:hypothetical protein [Pseudonocardiales bacterium]